MVNNKNQAIMSRKRAKCVSLSLVYLPCQVKSVRDMTQTERGCAKQARSRTRDTERAKATPSPSSVTAALPRCDALCGRLRADVDEGHLCPFPTRAAGSEYRETRSGEPPAQPSRGG